MMRYAAVKETLNERAELKKRGRRDKRSFSD